MTWLNKVRVQKVLFFFLLCLGCSIAVALLAGSFFPKRICTLLACLGNGVTILFSNDAQPEFYKIMMKSPEGIQTLTCAKGIAEPRSTPVGYNECFPDGAFLAHDFKYRLDDFLVTVDVNGKTFTKKLDRERCKEIDPNGDGCTPTCCWATIEFDLSH